MELCGRHFKSAIKIIMVDNSCLHFSDEKTVGQGCEELAKVTSLLNGRA